MSLITDYTFLWNYLAGLGKFDIIDLLHKAENKKIHTIKIKRQLVPDMVMHNTIINFLETNNIVVKQDKPGIL
jgi:hypothetical protein